MAVRKLATDFSIFFFLEKNLTLSFLSFSVTIRYFPSQEYSFYSLTLQLRLFINLSSCFKKYRNSKAINTAEVSIAYLGEITDLVISFHIPL